MGSHGNQGSKGRCSERQKSRFLDTWSVTGKARQDKNLGIHVHAFTVFIFLQSLHIWLHSSAVLLTPNQINSGGDTLLLSPPEFSTQRIFCLLVKTWLRGRVRSCEREMKDGQRERVSPRLLNHKWVRSVSEHEAHWCEMASWAPMQPPTHSSQRSASGKAKMDTSNIWWVITVKQDALERNSFCLEANIKQKSRPHSLK